MSHEYFVATKNGIPVPDSIDDFGKWKASSIMSYWYDHLFFDKKLRNFPTIDLRPYYKDQYSLDEIKMMHDAYSYFRSVCRQNGFWDLNPNYCNDVSSYPEDAQCIVCSRYHQVSISPQILDSVLCYLDRCMKMNEPIHLVRFP